MTEDETPLHQIAWTRLKRQLGQPPGFDAEALLYQAMKDHLLAFGRALLLTVAIVAAALWGRTELETFTSWLGRQLDWIGDYTVLLATLGLLMTALLLPRLASAMQRLWQWNQRRKFLPAITFGIILVLVALAETAHATASAWFCGLILWGLIFTQLKTTQVESKPTQDSFQRSYFVDRLMEVFVKAETRLRRIAILGTWGTGKTTVLKLLRERLAQSKEKNFRVAWVNPWTAKTPEEARALISQGFEDALGSSLFSLPSAPGYSPWSWISGLKTAMGFGVTFDLSRLIEGGAMATESAFIARINQRLAARNVTVVLLVDDMERAEPEVIRRIFPVIDRLGAIEHCFFVFAIDPNRVAKAFKEESRTAEETKGYLDKVFELKFDLPDLRTQDIATWGKADKRINPTDTPKLYAAWEHLADVLPNNPRDALNFIQDAVTKETLFLSRYADEELGHDFVGFFFVQMLELEMPGYTSLLDPKKVAEYREARVSQQLMLSEGITHHGEMIPEAKAKRIIDEQWLKLERAFPSKFQNPRLKEILEKMFASQVKLDWACSHYMRLLTPNAGERITLFEYWKVHCGQDSLDNLIKRALPGKSFSDNQTAAFEMIESEIMKHEDFRFKLVSPVGFTQEKYIKRAVESLGRLCSQLQYGYAQESEFDIECFPPGLFNTWFDMICKYQLSRVPDSDELLHLTYKFHILVSDRLTLSDRFKYANLSISDWANQALFDDRCNEHLDHLACLQNYMRGKIFDTLMLRSECGTLEDPPLISNLQDSYLATVFVVLSNWLPENGNSGITSIPAKAASSATFARSIARIVESVLRSLSSALFGTNQGPYGKKLISQVIAAPGDFAYFWKAAKFATDQQEYITHLRILLELRLEQSPAPLLTAEQLNAAFPVPAQAASPEQSPQTAGT